jgi:hypothetical protein
MKKIIALALVLVFVFSAVVFAAPSQGPQRYTVTLKGLDVHNADTNTWYRLMNTINDADLVYLSSGVAQHWFNTNNLIEGHYDRLRLVIGNQVTYRGSYTTGGHTYWTDPTSISGGSIIDDGVVQFPSNYDVINYTIKAGDIAQADANYKSQNASNSVYENGTGASASPRYAATDIVIRVGHPFELVKSHSKTMKVEWNVGRSLDFNTNTLTFGFDFPELKITVN